MLIVLPNKNKLVDNIEDIYQNIAEMNYQSIILKMPKFKFSTPLYDIKKYLKTLGIITPFSAKADFSNMTSEDNLFIDSMSHKSFIKLDENGIEAASATAGVESELGAIVNPINFNINRPFIIFIKDDMSKQILFIGLIKEPILRKIKYLSYNNKNIIRIKLELSFTNRKFYRKKWFRF
ncbi:MAG: hypothetical protein COB17_09515 [Sulfurimonas sp.]|nr:MAG: hypothetical protein COB17_09515 [Sulfurimonas sp.]